MTQQIANLPTAISAVIQDGILQRTMAKALAPALLWRALYTKEKVLGRFGERFVKTRDGLIVPDTRASLLRTPGQDPNSATRTVEQYQFQPNPFGKSIQTHLPSSFVAQANRFESDAAALGFHAAQSLGRMARDAIFAAYGGGNSFAAAAGSSATALVVQDATGFDTAIPATGGPPVPVSATNTLAITIAGAAAVVTGCSLATNTLTLSATATWSQYDAVVRGDAPNVVRQAARTTDHLLVAGDTPTFQTFRNAAAYLRGHNVPGIDGVVGGLYACYIDSDVENALFSDSEFRQAIAAVGNVGVYAEGTIGVYAGIRFMRMPKSESGIIATGGAYQTTVHRSLMFGGDVGVEGFFAEAEFAGEVNPAGVALLNHYKMPLDPDGVITMIIRAPLDAMGEIVTQSWGANVDWCIPSDRSALTGVQRHKRACLIHTAGPA